MSIERIDAPGLYSSPGFPAVSLARGSRLLFVNGQVSRDHEGNLVGGSDAVAQAEQAFRNLRLALEGAGATGGDVVQYRVTVVNCTSELVTPIMMASQTVFFDQPIIAPSILVGAVMLGRPDYLVEVEAIAVLD